MPRAGQEQSRQGGRWDRASTPSSRLGLPLQVYKFHYSSSEGVSLPRR